MLELCSFPCHSPGISLLSILWYHDILSNFWSTSNNIPSGHQGLFISEFFFPFVLAPRHADIQRSKLSHSSALSHRIDNAGFLADRPPGNSCLGMLQVLCLSISTNTSAARWDPEAAVPQGIFSSVSFCTSFLITQHFTYIDGDF